MLALWMRGSWFEFVVCLVFFSFYLPNNVSSQRQKCKLFLCISSTLTAKITEIPSYIPNGSPLFPAELLFEQENPSAYVFYWVSVVMHNQCLESGIRFLRREESLRLKEKRSLTSGYELITFVSKYSAPPLEPSWHFKGLDGRNRAT